MFVEDLPRRMTGISENIDGGMQVTSLSRGDTGILERLAGVCGEEYDQIFEMATAVSLIILVSGGFEHERGRRAWHRDRNSSTIDLDDVVIGVLKSERRARRTHDRT